jgi:hypothetical protein
MHPLMPTAVLGEGRLTRVDVSAPLSHLGGDQVP